MAILLFYALIIMISCRLAIAFLSPQAQTLPQLHRAMREQPNHRKIKIAYALTWLQISVLIAIALIYGIKYFQAA
ncbi:hypothetical protein MIS46_03850 [Wielerella bovis]|uniref:hypothetical protein n=1 Tax=Wielerella bovis TaxID=2917790 RepID=UPI0020186103|nr:hypothetical protein [Wielerella bovis]ULJ63193.1 hypothetical protein MIS46_03850 [Wielerella bovis]